MKQGLVYDVNQKPPFGKNLLFALQQFLAIIAATILVPILADGTGTYLSQSAALIGAGVGTLVYLAFTKFKSPVFLGSSFAFILPLATAVTYGYLGIILGSVFCTSDSFDSSFAKVSAALIADDCIFLMFC